MMSRDELLYVCDRVNNRIQVFRPDGVQNRGAQGPGGRRDAPRPAVLAPHCQFVISGAGGVVRLKGKLRSYVI